MYTLSEMLMPLVCKLSLCNSLVKVDVQFGGIFLAAHQKWLLQSLEVLSIQVLIPLTEVLPHHLIQNLDHLAIGHNYLLAAV